MKVELHKLFYTPVWRFHYPDFEEDEEFLVRYFAQDHLYITEREMNGLQITRPNVHKDPKIKKLKDFFIESAKYAMTEMGYVDNCDISSMWATRQKPGGFHHFHYHHNCFLACAFHLFDVDKKAGGTSFFNSSSDRYVIQPQIADRNNLMLCSESELPFIPGTLVMFPGWAGHKTKPSNCEYRMIVAANIVPIGKTNIDHFDRYNFPPIEDMDLIEYGDELSNSIFYGNQ